MSESLKPTSPGELQGRLLHDIFGRDIVEDDALLLFTIFHYHWIELSRPQVLESERRENIRYAVRVGPLSPLRCAEALASVWAGELDVRAEPSYWQCRWQDDWGGYVRVRQLASDALIRIHELIGLLEGHPFVARLVADGSQPFPSRDRSE